MYIKTRRRRGLLLDTPGDFSPENIVSLSLIAMDKLNLCKLSAFSTKTMFEFDCCLICRLRLPCLAVEVGEVGQEVTTGGLVL